MSNDDLYIGREQTLVKHIILKHYLERFAIIVGSHWDTLTYVDCFSGPWNVQSNDFKDSSFAIAIEQLRKARDVHKKRTGNSLKLRCFFLEKTPSAYTKLKQFADKINDVIIETKKEARKCHPGHRKVCASRRSHFVSFHIYRSNGMVWICTRTHHSAPKIKSWRGADYFHDPTHSTFHRVAAEAEPRKLHQTFWL